MAQDQGVFIKGQPISHDQGHTAIPSCLSHVENALVPVPGSHVGSSLTSHNSYNASLTGWGGIMSGCSCSVEGPSFMAHKLPGDVDRVLNMETLPPRPQRPSCACSYRKHIGGLISTDSGGGGCLRSCPLCKLAHQNLLWGQRKLLSLKAVYIPGHLNQGAGILLRQWLRPGEWRLYPEVVEQIWRVFSEAQLDLFVSPETSRCPLWFSLTHPAPLERDAIPANMHPRGPCWLFVGRVD